MLLASHLPAPIFSKKVIVTLSFRDFAAKLWKEPHILKKRFHKP
jgi:hypothetical protein